MISVTIFEKLCLWSFGLPLWMFSLTLKAPLFFFFFFLCGSSLATGVYLYWFMVIGDQPPFFLYLQVDLLSWGFLKLAHEVKSTDDLVNSKAASTALKVYNSRVLELDTNENLNAVNAWCLTLNGCHSWVCEPGFVSLFGVRGLHILVCLRCRPQKECRLAGPYPRHWFSAHLGAGPGVST